MEGAAERAWSTARGLALGGLYAADLRPDKRIWAPSAVIAGPAS